MTGSSGDAERIYYVHGKFLPADKAVIPVDDLAVIRGIGVCDLMRTFKGTPLFLREHVERLVESARAVELDIRWSCEEIENIIMETLDKNPSINESNIRTIITGGSSSNFMTPNGNPRLLVLITPIPPIPVHWYEKGIKVITVPFQRDIPKAKSLSYMKASLALKQAGAAHASEALYVDPEGYVTEGTTSNLFAFVNETLVTAEHGVLKGITRKAILKAAGEKFPVGMRTLHLDELYKAEEVFISGTNKGVVPVVQVDDQIIGEGKPGRNTLELIELVQKNRVFC
ncbi:MAG: aminotransferase class IV [Desulfamplus sp.]|nr:aminotransferase class IV [Desulfamplus sp.]